jgi:hypothetical protein
VSSPIFDALPCRIDPAPPSSAPHSELPSRLSRSSRPKPPRRPTSLQFAQEIGSSDLNCQFATTPNIVNNQLDRFVTPPLESSAAPPTLSGTGSAFGTAISTPVFPSSAPITAIESIPPPLCLSSRTSFSRPGSIESLDISTPKAPRSTRSSDMLQPISDLTQARASTPAVILGIDAYHNEKRGRADGLQIGSLRVLAGESAGRSHLMTIPRTSKIIKRQSLPPLLCDVKLGDPAFHLDVKKPRTRLIEDRRRSCVPVDFPSDGPQLKNPRPGPETLHPRFSFEPALSYRMHVAATETSEDRIPGRPSIGTPTYKNTRQSIRGERSAVLGVRVKNAALHDAIKERLDVLTQETKSLLDLLTNLSNDYMGQGQPEGGELVAELEAFLGEVNFKAFERCKKPFVTYWKSAAQFVTDLDFYDKGTIPLGGPNGLLSRVRRLLEDATPPRESSLRARLYAPSNQIDERHLQGKRLYQRFACFAANGMFA